MSIILSIFGNHKMKINSYESGIDEIEEALGIEIIDFKKGDKAPVKLENSGELKLWTNHKFHKMKFNEWGIWLNCNHNSCDRIRVFKNSIDFTINEVNTRYNIWKDLISNQYQAKEKYSDYKEVWQEQVKNWQEFKSFAEEILFKFGGDTFIYLNDANFQDIEGDLWNGEDFEEAIKRLHQKSVGIELEELINDKEGKFEEMGNWFIERIKKEASR